MTTDDKKINVVFMGHFHFPHGMAITRHVRNYVEYLVGSGEFDVKVLVLRQGRDRLRGDPLCGQYKGIEYVTVGNDIRPGVSALFKGPNYFWNGIRYLTKSRCKNGRNILYVRGYPSIDNIPMLIHAKVLGYRIIFDIVEDIGFVESASDFLAKMKDASARWFLWTLPMFADSVVVISRHLKEKIGRLARGRFDVTIFPISVDLKNFNCAPRPFGDPVRIFYGGTFASKDGVENLITAFEDICKKHENVQLILTGKGSRDRMASILKMIADSAVSRRINYAGYLDDEAFYRELNGSDILCMTRTASAFANTGFPFKLGEYLATGRPVIASDVSDVSQYLTDRESAVLIRPDSSGAIAEAIEYLIADRERAMRIGAAGREVAEKYFDVKVVAEKLRRLLTEL
jgi:glycosyltransferase involved in cell wall biosynthesis